MIRNLFIFYLSDFSFRDLRKGKGCVREWRNWIWDSIEMAAEIIDSNNRYSRSRLVEWVTIRASQEENQRNFPLTTLVWLPRLILTLSVCHWRNSQLVEGILRDFAKTFLENHWNSEILPKSFVENCQFKACRCLASLLKVSGVRVTLKVAKPRGR